MPPVLKIKTKQDAQELWKRFHAKHSNPAKGISPEKKRQYEARLTDEEKEEYEKKIKAKASLSGVNLTNAALIIQERWRKKRTQDALIEVNHEGNHHSTFNDFVNQQKIKRSLNKIKADQLQSALDKADWNDPIFSDPLLSEVAMSLFSSEKITRHQLTTILDRNQTFKDFPHIQTFKILNDKDEFTEEAKALLLPKITKRPSLRELSRSQIEEMRLLISTLPKSEQIFYTTSSGKLMEEEGKHSMGRELIRRNTLLLLDEDTLLNLSNGARDAVNLALFGERNYIPSLSQLGMQKPADIENGIRKQNVRNGAIYYPETISHPPIIHDFKNVTDYEATRHDEYHSDLMSAIPLDIRNCLLRMVDVTRASMGFDTNSSYLSKEIWHWIDCDFLHAFKNHRSIRVGDLNAVETTRLFCEVMEHSHTIGGHLANLKIKIEKSEMTWCGAAVYLDMLKNPKVWLDMKIHPDHLTIPFSDHFQIVKEIYSHIKNDSKEVQILKCLLYADLKKHNKEKAFPVISDIINEDVESIKGKISFYKVKSSEVVNKRNANRTVMKFNDEAISSKTVFKILQDKCDSLMPSAKQHPKDFFSYAVLSLHFNAKQAEIYTNERLQRKSMKEARFNAKPTLLNWLGHNPFKSFLLGISVIGAVPLLIYAGYKIYQQEKVNKENEQKKVNALDAEVSPDPTSIISSYVQTGLVQKDSKIDSYFEDEKPVPKAEVPKKDDTHTPASQVKDEFLFRFQ